MAFIKLVGVFLEKSRGKGRAVSLVKSQKKPVESSFEEVLKKRKLSQSMQAARRQKYNLL